MRSIVAIVDPDAATHRRVRSLLGDIDLDIFSYMSAEQFLAQREASIGCLVLEQSLPGMQGLELLAELRANETQLPILMVSRDAEIELAADAIRLGANDFIDKSQLEIALPRRIAKHLRSREASRH
ncbi:MAG TPA: response regulator [Steroidobacteraceae bacterium]|nr:response regulator [Steroidobacteraceae bacterium]